MKLVSRRSKVVKSRGSFRCSKKKLDRIAPAWMCILILIDRGVLVEEKKEKRRLPIRKGIKSFSPPPAGSLSLLVLSFSSPFLSFLGLGIIHEFLRLGAASWMEKETLLS